MMPVSSLPHTLSVLPDYTVGKLFATINKPELKDTVIQKKMAQAQSAKAGPKAAKNAKPLLERTIATNPYHVAGKGYSELRSVDRDIFKKNADKLEQEALKFDSLAVEADENAKSSMLKFKALLPQDLQAEDIFAHLKSDTHEDFFKKIKTSLDKTRNPSDVEMSALKNEFFSAKAHLDRQEHYQDRATIAREHSQLNSTLFETMRMPAIRGLARVVNEKMRAQMMQWLNIVGMLTMVATLPLMYEGLKQWAQQVGSHPQNGQQ